MRGIGAGALLTGLAQSAMIALVTLRYTMVHGVPLGKAGIEKV